MSDQTENQTTDSSSEAEGTATKTQSTAGCLVLIVIAVLVIGGVFKMCGGGSPSVEDLPKYKAVDLANLSATHEIIDPKTFDLISTAGIYGVAHDGSYRSWGSIESLRTRLISIADGDKPVAIVGRFRGIGLDDYEYSYYNANCWSTPNRRFWVGINLDYYWDDLPEYKARPKDDEMKSWGQFDCVVTGVLHDFSAKGAKSACENGRVSLVVKVHEIYNKTTGVRVWPPVE